MSCATTTVGLVRSAIHRSIGRAHLDCLGIPNQDVEKTHVKEIILGFRIREKDC
jgi:hypothetical protein